MNRHVLVAAAVAVACAGVNADGRAAGTAGQASIVRVEDAWIRTSPPSRDVTGGYLTIINAGNDVLRLVSASSPQAKSIELHEMTMDGDVMRMRPVAEIAVPARGRTMLQPGGLHLMLFGFSMPSKAGARVPLTLTFADGRVVSVDAIVRAAEVHH